MTTENIETNDSNVAEIVDAPQPPAMRIVRIGECASLSGRSTLTYHIGCRQSDGEIHLRLFDNSATGYFCKDWTPMASLQVLFESTDFTSGDVQHLLFEGKSINSGAFLVAALRNEGLIRTTTGTLRRYEPLDPTEWQLEILALIESDVSLSEERASSSGVRASSSGVRASSSEVRAKKVASRKKSA